MEATLAGHYYQATAYGAIKAGQEAGVTVHIVSAGQGYADPSIQLQQADNVLQKGTDALVLVPVDYTGSVPVVTKFKQKGLPVVNEGTEIATDAVDAVVMQDDYIMGKLAADEVHRLVPSGGEGIIIAGPANATWSRKRAAGFQDQAAAKYSNLKVVAAPTQNVDPSLGLKSFDNATKAHPNIKWVYTVFNLLLEPESMPAQYKSVAFVTDGYDYGSLKSLQDGRISSIAGITPVWMGYYGVGYAISLLNGQKPPKLTCIPIPILTKQDIGSAVANAELVPPGFKVS
jgi:ribose transport system substrate-binding protein